METSKGTSQEKFDYIVKIARSYIVMFLDGILDSSKLAHIENYLSRFPIEQDKISSQTNEFGKTVNIGGIATKDKITIELKKTNPTNQFEFDNLLGFIIHEMAHKICTLNHHKGMMLEEAFASIFAEACINNAKKMLKEDNEKYEMQTSYDYRVFESQAHAILYVLKKYNLDNKMIAEFIAGDQMKFISTCKEIFGKDFERYFDAATSMQNENAEGILINILVDYIKNNGLDINRYWQDKDTLYATFSDTLSKAVTRLPASRYKEDEQESYHLFECNVKVARETTDLVNNETIDRIQELILNEFSIRGKTFEDAYDTVIELCSFYIQHRYRADEESKTFKSEIKKMLPYIDDFVEKMLILRREGKDKGIFVNLEPDSITYDQIYTNINYLLKSRPIELLEKSESSLPIDMVVNEDTMIR